MSVTSPRQEAVDKTILVKRFTAPWCGPCRTVKPIMEALEKEFPQVTFQTIDIDVTPEEELIPYGVRSIPAVLIFENGEEVTRIVGSLPKAEYQRVLEKYL
jgi:thiol-disulfide isomerase/thioredoxin